MKKDQFKKRGEYSIKEATLIAYNLQLSTFYLNSVTKIVLNLMKPFKPYDSSISRKLRELMEIGQIKYVANNEGVYSKIQM